MHQKFMHMFMFEEALNYHKKAAYVSTAKIVAYLLLDTKN